MSRVDGEMTQIADQSSDSALIQSVSNNQAERIPVVLIVGEFEAWRAVILACSLHHRKG